MDTLLGISIQQPWLDMILRGFKTVELRRWQMRERGTIALHAPIRIDFGAAYFYGYSQPSLLPTRKILALADVVDVQFLDREQWLEHLVEHRQPIPDGGLYAITLTNVRLLKKPFPYRGSPKLFLIKEDIAARLRKAALDPPDYVATEPLWRKRELPKENS